MKKWLKIIVAMFLVMIVAAPAMAAFQDMWANVYSWNGNCNGDGTMVLTRQTSGITFLVLQADSDTEETLYYYGNNAMTSLSNIVSADDFADSTKMKDAGVLSFRVDPGETNDRYVDLFVIDTDGGYMAFVENFDKTTHNIVIDERPGILHHGMYPFDYALGSASEIDTGINFQYDTLITDVRTETVTLDAGITIEVGLKAKTGASGDSDGFIDARSVAAAGYTADTGFITAGTSIDYYPDSTYGDLLYTILAGTGAGSAANNGGLTHKGHIIDYALNSASDLSYTLLTAANTAYGFIHYYFIKMR